MGYVARRPGPLLAPFVEHVWWFASDAGFPHARERIMPSGAMQLLVNLAGDELRSYHGDGYREARRIRGAAMCGAWARHFAIDTDEQRHVCGVAFRPGGAAAFLGLPADELAEQHVELDQVWGRGGAVLRERLLEAGGAGAVLDALLAALREQLVRPERDPAVGFALDAFGRDLPVGDVTARLGLSPRRFIRRFAGAVGLTPKRFARVRRFQRVLDAFERGGRVDWARVAADCGYFDQAHLIHDFRGFSGLSPTRYRPRSDAGRSHVPLL
jgi:AraC-like DNA-binding protein